MAENTKGRSPFYPGQPIPVDLFTGRIKPLRRIMTRGVSQVVSGKPVTMFVQGEYGIGKSSLANYARAIAEKEEGNNLHGVYVTLGGANSLEDVGGTILEGFIHSGADDPKRSRKIRDWLEKYITRQTLFDVEIKTEAIKRDAHRITKPDGCSPSSGSPCRSLKEPG